MILFYNDLLRVKSIIPHGGRGVLWLNYVYNLQKYLTSEIRMIGRDGKHSSNSFV